MLVRVWRKEYNNLPSPGLCLPFLGHYTIFLETTEPLKRVWNLYKKYSQKGLMLMTVLGQNMVIVGDFDTLKQLFNNPDVQNRGHGDYQKCQIAGKVCIERGTKLQPLGGIFLSQGKIWSEQRRLTVKTLKDFGFGKSSMEEIIQDEFKQFINYLQQLNPAEPREITGLFTLPILNSLWKITVGESFAYDNPKLERIHEMLGEFVKNIVHISTFLEIMYPWIFDIFPNFLNRQSNINIHKSLASMMLESIDHHRKTLDVNSPRDVIDTVLIEIENTEDESSSFYKETGYANLVNTLIDLFMGGSETTATTLTWAVLYMVREPQVQRKVQAELDALVGSTRPITLADRPKLPYTEAVMMEIQRCGNIVPFALYHMSSIPIEINGLSIPANTMICPCIAEIQKGNGWKDGMSFRPERFLDESGGIKPNELLIPFSIGKRRCPGETFAMMEFFLFFTNILLHFSFLPEAEGQVPTEEYFAGLTVIPKPFKSIIMPRTQN